ncbi:MAG: V-type ATP synthase subunit E family protein [bacterium]|jgi:vacuolar-type H+-ATPase subunit E/Vma4
MTETEGTHQESAIIEEILADAEAQARKLVENAGRSAVAEEKKTEKEIEKIREDARAGWDSRVEKIRMREVSTARIEARRILLDAREQAVAKMFAEIEEGLDHLREDPGRYRESLRNLAVEAVAAIGGEGVVLRFSEKDRGLADEALLGEIRAGVEAVAGGTAFQAEFTAGAGGGCVAASADGRVVFDNTLGRRLERMRSGIRAMIVGRLANNDE